jgi:hypothetical protein
MTESPSTGSGEPSRAAGPPGRALPYSYPPGAYPPPQYPGFPPAPTGSGNGLALASLLIGIIALATSPFLSVSGLGIAAVAMGLAARRWVKRGEATHGGVALARIVLGMLATAVGLAIGAILVVGLATDQFNEDY